MVRRPEPRGVLREREVGGRRRRVEGGAPGGRGAGAVHRQRAVRTQAPHHVEVDHVVDPFGGHGQRVDEVLRAVEAQFLAGEGHEQDVVAAQSGRPEPSGHLQERRHAARVVVGAVVDERVARRARPDAAVAEVVVVRPDDDRAVGPIVQMRDDVAPGARRALAGRGVRVGAVRDVERLRPRGVEPRRQPKLLEPLRDVPGGEAGALGSRLAALQQVGREVPDVDAQVVECRRVRDRRGLGVPRPHREADQQKQGQCEHDPSTSAERARHEGPGTERLRHSGRAGIVGRCQNE